MITRLGALAEEGSSAQIKVGGKKVTIMALYTAKVVLPGKRFGQVVEVVEHRRSGDVVCVFEGQRFVLPETGVERVRRRTSRKRKSKSKKSK